MNKSTINSNTKDLSITLLQTPLFWEDREKNFAFIHHKLFPYRGKQHLIVLPEMFNTAFSMKPELLAETMDGESIAWMKKFAAQMESVIAGTLMINEGGHYFNRFVWVTPEGEMVYYDKRHLFSLGKEPLHFSSGKGKIIIEITGWRIMPLVCYDLRFPVWSMNEYDHGDYLYDMLVYPASWPTKRTHHWRSLLMARAIENQCFVAGVNRTGDDGNGLPHDGNSLIIDPLGEILEDAGNASVYVLHQTLSRETLERWRKGFQAGADWSNSNETKD